MQIMQLRHEAVQRGPRRQVGERQPRHRRAPFTQTADRQTARPRRPPSQSIGGRNAASPIGLAGLRRVVPWKGSAVLQAHQTPSPPAPRR
jgi:hypothetical protein